MFRVLFVSLLLSVFLVGCDNGPVFNPPNSTPLAESLAVYSTVRAFDSLRYAAVTRPRPRGERTLRYVQDASVSVAGASLSVIPEDSIDSPETITFDRQGLGPPAQTSANYAANAIPIEPGETYQLRVRRGEQEVVGRTRVPGSFTGEVDSMTVRWSASAGAQEYTLRVLESGGDWRYTTTTEDTVVTVPRSGEFEEGTYELMITAFDSNLVAYQDPDVLRSGIDGGFGFFGAVTRIRGEVELPATDDENRKAQPPLRPRPRRADDPS